MQNVHELLHPIVIVTHAEHSDSREAGNTEGIASVERVSSQISVTGPHSSAWSSRSRTRCELWVPNTTSTHSARSRIVPRSFWAVQPPTTICIPGRSALSRFKFPR